MDPPVKVTTQVERVQGFRERDRLYGRIAKTMAPVLLDFLNPEP
jgi:hypothetical protein